jgi:hypothetical protein
MEAIERIDINNDWITFILLVVLFIFTMINFLDKKRLHQLIILPFNTFYFSAYEKTHDNLMRAFTWLLFISSNLILGLFFYFLFQHFYPEQFELQKHPFLNILGISLLYWLFRFIIGNLFAFIFDVEKEQKNAVYVKMSYFFSINFYLFVLLIFGVYNFGWEGTYLKIVLGIYVILLTLRYYRYLVSINKLMFYNLFYFILYICTLEIAPLLIAYKWSLD